MGIRKLFTGGIRFLKQEVLLLFFAIGDERTPLYAKLTSILALIYLISPIDLVPDFIPFVGYLDDLVIVPLLIKVAYRLLPASVMQTAQLKAVTHAKKAKWVLWATIFIIIGLMSVFVVWGVYLLKAVIRYFSS